MLDAVGSWGADAKPKEEVREVASKQPESQALPKMVEIFSEECGVCQQMKPLVERLVEQCDKKGVRVELLDISRPENRYLISEYRVVGVPTFLFLDENELEVARLVGEQSESALRQAMAALRGEACPGLGPLPPKGG